MTISLDKRMLKLFVLVSVVSTALVSMSMDQPSFCPNIHSNQSPGAIQIPTTFYGSGPIFLDELECTSSDNDLLSCRTTFTSVGLTSCNHSQDVSVRCIGMIVDEASFAIVMTLLMLCTCRHQ